MFKEKRLIVAMLVFAALFSGCSKNNAEPEQPTGSDNEIVLSNDNKEASSDIIIQTMLKLVSVCK